jgi:hypothetical protein
VVGLKVYDFNFATFFLSFFLSFEEPTVNQLNEKQYHIFVRREEKRREEKKRVEGCIVH